MLGLVIALIGGLGVFYLYTALALGWRGVQPGPEAQASTVQIKTRRGQDWLTQAGLEEVGMAQFVVAIGGISLLGFLLGFAMFGGVLPALAMAAFAGSTPIAAFRVQRRRRLERAHESWPRMIEEIRILTSSAGRSVPQALFDVGRRAPEEMRSAFDAAQREWLITTDFERTITVLKARLADTTADVAVETLLVAHHLGGTDLDQRLRDLAEDRIIDTQGRKDAAARQAGVRFARWFTIIVPLGMAMVGMSIGSGRQSFQTATGQLLVLLALLIMIGCWAWAGYILRLPEEERVFTE